MFLFYVCTGIVPTIIGVGSFLGAFLRGQSRMAQAQVRIKLLI